MIVGTNINLRLSNKEILRNVCIQLDAGEILALCGPNGAGKSTLLSCLAGEHSDCAASISYFGTKLSSLSALQQSRMRVVLEQSPSISAEFTLSELIELGAPIDLSPDRLEYLKDQLLAEFHFHDLVHRSVSTLSGGQLHRAHLARVLLHLRANIDLGHTCFLFLDEPTASLDIAHQINLLRLTSGIAKEGVGILVVLHDLNLAAAYADRVALMRNGEIAYCDRPDVVLTEQKLSSVYETPIFVERSKSGQTVIQPSLMSS